MRAHGQTTAASRARLASLVSQPRTDAAPRRSLAADGTLLALTAFWGVSFSIVKGALDDSDPFTFLALRFLVGAFAAALIARTRLLDRTLVRPAAALGVFLFLGFLTQTWGLQTTTPARSAFITGLFVVFVPFFSWAFFKRRPAWTAFVAVALAFAGMYRLSGADLGGSLSAGDWLTFACAIAYAVHLVLTEHYAKGRDAGPLVSLQLVVVAALACAVWPFAPHRWAPTLGYGVAVLVAGVFSTALAISLQTWAQARTSAVRAALIIAVEPVFATAWSVFRGRDTLDARLVEGGTFILLGVAVSELGAVLKKR